jgi:hypothetical protein
VNKLILYFFFELLDKQPILVVALLLLQCFKDSLQYQRYYFYPSDNFDLFNHLVIYYGYSGYNYFYLIQVFGL